MTELNLFLSYCRETKNKSARMLHTKKKLDYMFQRIIFSDLNLLQVLNIVILDDLKQKDIVK